MNTFLIKRFSEFSLCRSSPLEITSFAECKNNVLQTLPNYQTIKHELMHIINNKTKSIIISCYGWEEGHVLIDKLCELSTQGVAVTVLARPRSQYGKIFIKMKKSGIRVYGFKWLHDNKAV